MIKKISIDTTLEINTPEEYSPNQVKNALKKKLIKLIKEDKIELNIKDAV